MPMSHSEKWVVLNAICKRYGLLGIRYFANPVARIVGHVRSRWVTIVCHFLGSSCWYLTLSNYCQEVILKI